MDELFTERMLLKDVLPEVAKNIAKEYELEEDNIEFIRKNNPLKPEDIEISDGEKAAIRFINTADVDRDNEIVLPDGAQVKDFLKSPSVLYAHDYRGLPIGRDKWLKLISGKGWLAKTLYAEHELAVDVYNLVKKKFLNTSSIGFIPLESVTPDKKGWDKIKDKLIAEYGIKEKLIDKVKRIYTKWVLLEHSDVPIPSNINALNVAVGKGFIKSDQLIKDLEIEIIDDKSEELKDDNEKIEETEEYIRIPAKGEEGKHKGHKIRWMTVSAKEGIRGIYCIDCKKIITFIFDKKKGWTLKKAKKWMADHGKAISDYIEGAEEEELEEYREGKEDIDIDAAMVLKATKEDIKISEEEKGVIPFRETPKAPEGEAWDAGAEVKKASGNATRLKTMHTWVDSGADNFDADERQWYKLPHHKGDGTQAVVWRGVAAGMAVLFGARGGVTLPAGDRKGCYNHLVKHYKQFDKEPPEFRDYDEAELKGLFPDEQEGKLKEIGLFDIKELAEIVNRNKELIKENKGLKEEIKDLELKAGAVLNRKNKTDLIEAQKRIQNVLDSATSAEEEGKSEELEIEEPAELEIDEKENQGQKDNTEKEEETIEIDEKELIEIIHSTLEEQFIKSAENISKDLKQGISDNFKKMTGKVM